jgi:hypothetical protein
LKFREPRVLKADEGLLYEQLYKCIKSIKKPLSKTLPDLEGKPTAAPPPPKKSKKMLFRYWSDLVARKQEEAQKNNYSLFVSSKNKF